MRTRRRNFKLCPVTKAKRKRRKKLKSESLSQWHSSSKNHSDHSKNIKLHAGTSFSSVHNTRAWCLYPWLRADSILYSYSDDGVSDEDASEEDEEDEGDEEAGDEEDEEEDDKKPADGMAAILFAYQRIH